MTPRNLDRIRDELEALRRGRHKAVAFQRVAKRLGRKENTRRGKEPMWESEPFPDLFPLAIPYHGGRDISPGVQRTLLDLMDEDVLRWEEWLAEQSDGEDDGGEQQNTEEQNTKEQEADEEGDDTD